jgi:hypothetical protein
LNKVRLVLTLLTVGLTLGPLVFEVYVYRDNLTGLVVPADLSGLMSGDYSNSSISGVIDDLNKTVKLPEYVSSEYDPVLGVIKFMFNFTNPFGFDLNLRSMDANVACTIHGFALGKASLFESVNLGSGETGLLPLKLVFTEQALDHLQVEHGNAKTLNVDLSAIKVDVSGVSLSLPQKYTVNDVPLR